MQDICCGRESHPSTDMELAYSTVLAGGGSASHKELDPDDISLISSGAYIAFIHRLEVKYFGRSFVFYDLFHWTLFHFKLFLSSENLIFK